MFSLKLCNDFSDLLSAELEKIKAVDMFPQIMHVETVVLMSRK